MIRHAALLAGLGLASLLGTTQADEIRLFNGKDLTGWSAVLEGDSAKIDDVWSVKDGVLHCKGQPVGYIRTDKDDYGDYKLTLQYRWPEGAKGGNNGVLVHTSDPGALGIWPRSIEVQLAQDNAGDFWVIGTDLDVPDEATRKQGRRHVNLTDGSEKPPGQWNTMEIVCEGDTITVKVNGELVNAATNCTVNKGSITLQSEGAPIDFKDIVLTPLK